MRKFFFLLALVAVSMLAVVAQDKTDSKDDFVLKLVNDIMSVCEEGQDTTLINNVVMTSDSLKSYIISMTKGDSISVKDLSDDDKKVVADFINSVVQKSDSATTKTIVTTVKRSDKKITLDFDFDAIGDSVVFNIDLDSVQTK